MHWLRPARARHAWVGLCLYLTLLSCGEGAAAPGRGLLLIAVDAWRAEPLSLESEAGVERRRFRRTLMQGVQFSSAWTAAPEMLAAHTSLLTGCDPRLGSRPTELIQDPELMTWEWNLSADVPRLAEAFLADGWRTAAFVDDVRLAGRSGLDQGFQVFEDPGKALRAKANRDPHGIDGVARRFHEWLRERSSAERWFAYLQLADLDRMWRDLSGEYGELAAEQVSPGDPLLPVSETGSAFFAVPRRRFDGVQRSLHEYQAYYQIARNRLEHKLGGLMLLLDKLGWTEHTTIVLVGSHGFSFGESGLLLDSGSLSDVDLHVPLVFHPAKHDTFEGGRVLGELVSTMDLAPTLLDLAGVPRMEGMHGESFHALLQGEAQNPREYVFASSGVVGGFAVIDSRYCYERTLFDGGPLSLPSSWKGLDRLNKEELLSLRGSQIEVVHDRKTDHSAGHLHAPAGDPETRERLRLAGETWNALVLRARMVLHDPTGVLHELAPGEVSELRKLRMLGRLRLVEEAPE